MKSIVKFTVNIENLKKTKMWYIFKKTLSLSIVYSTCGHQYEKLFKEKESIEILKVFGWTTNIDEYQKHIIIFSENISQGFRLKNINETRNYLIKEINQNKLMSKKHEKACRVLNYIEH